jgi:RHS repeat-associated protein
VDGTVTRYVLDNSMSVRETDGMGVSLATYLIGPRGPEYRRSDPAGTIRWYCMDGLGSVLAEVDPTGALTATRKYDVYGGVRASGGSSTSKHRFVGSLGHASEDETGLIYMRARWMDPAVGRFISEDPARDGGNWFDYCAGNPVIKVDPSGRALEDPNGYVARVYVYMGLSSSLLMLAAACVAPGPRTFLTVCAMLIASAATWLIADALKDAVYPNAGAMGGLHPGRRRSAESGVQLRKGRGRGRVDTGRG